MAARAAFPDWRFAPNIGGHPDVYEIENRALDPAGHVLAAMRKLAPWDGRTLVDLGCGTGFWLAGYARDAARVIGIEPDPALRARAEARIRGVPRAEVVPGSAEHLPLADRSVDVVHARFAYFLTPGIVGGTRAASIADGTRAAPITDVTRAAPITDGMRATPIADRTRAVPIGGNRAAPITDGMRAAPIADRTRAVPIGGNRAAPTGGGRAARTGGDRAAGGEGKAADAPGDAGLAEVMRVLRPGGSLIVVDNDYRWGEFADLLAAAASAPPPRTAKAIDSWWRERGATRHEVRSQLRFATRADLAAVLNIEVPATVARAWLARHPAATTLTYGQVLFALTRAHRVSPAGRS